MVSSFTAIYDACVLYPAPLRDLLMRLAVAGLFRARWSEDIHDEWIRNVAKDRPELSLERLHRTKQLMDSHVLDAVVSGYEPLVDSLTLPDPGDRHVLAAAIHCGADVIVTSNLKDFPDSELSRFGIEAQKPDDFIIHLIDLHPNEVLNAFEKQRAGLRNPVQTAEQLLSTLRRNGLTKTVSTLFDLLDSESRTTSPEVREDPSVDHND